MNTASVAKEVLRDLEANSTERYRDSISVFIKTKYRILGVSTEGFKKVKDDFEQKYPDLGISDRILLAKTLRASDVLEAHGICHYLISSRKEVMEQALPEALEWLTAGLDNWGQVDSLGILITGVGWREGLIDDATVHQWLKSDNPFLRRLAVVSTVPLNREMPGDVRRTLAVCKKVVDDHHDTMQKGLSWALRALIKIDGRAVEKFIEQNEDRLAARVKREVRNKLKTGLKNPSKAKKR